MNKNPSKSPDEELDPLPITLKVIFDALEDLLPNHVYLIMACIKRIVVLPKSVMGFSTLGINKFGDLVICEPFWNKYITSEEALKTLLMHELLHQISGDVFTVKTKDDCKDWESINEANNIAMDSRINAFIYRMFKDIDPGKFLKEFYDDSHVFNKLLKPESYFSKEEKDFHSEYNRFYNEDELQSHHRLADLILDTMKKEQQQGKGKKKVIILLGGHGAGDEGTEGLSKEDLEGATVIEVAEDGTLTSDEPISDQLKEAVNDFLIEKGAMGCDPNASKVTTQFLNESQEILKRLDVERFKKLSFDSIFANIRLQARQRIGKYTSVPFVPTQIARSDMFLMNCGIDLFLYKHRKYVYHTDKQMLPIYLDVSGSTWSYLPQIIQMIINVNADLDYVWGFSTVVHKHTIDDLRNRRIQGTGGTNFSCIAKHAIKNGYKHIVVMSDGEAWDEPSHERLPEIESVVTILFGYANKDNYFSKHYKNTFSIDEVTI